MDNGPVLVDVIRGEFLECVHHGHWVAVNAKGEVLDGAGDPDLMHLPRSAIKPVQALPLIDSGAAQAYALRPQEIALSAASHQGAPVHTQHVDAWLARIGLSETDLRCGMQPPSAAKDRDLMRAEGRTPNQTHNNCSGKHSGFLTLAKHLKAGPEYIDIDHPVQVAVRDAVEDFTGIASPGWAIDGCSAPNHATTLRGLARAMARIAEAREDAPGARERAAFRVRQSMIAHPDLVAGEGRACTWLIRLMQGAGVAKTGAEGVFAAALPHLGIGIALKITDGATRASNAAITAILCRLGALDPNDPQVQLFLTPGVKNRRKIVTGHIRPRIH